MSRQSSPLGVISQVRRALKPANRLAAAVGFLLGAFVPVAIFVVAHHEAGPLAVTGSWGLVFGGLLYSAQTVFSWARMAFVNVAKSLGFCVLLEGVMITSTTHWLSVAALCYLVAINAVATACTLSRQA